MEEVNLSDFENEVMPNFSDETENITMTVTETTTTTTIKKKGRKPNEHQMTEEEKKEKMRQYYLDSKEHRLKYKQITRGHVAPENKAHLHTEYLPKHTQQTGKKPTTNLDWLYHKGSKRTLTITQPTDEIIALLKANGIIVEKSIDGTLEL